MKPLAVFVGHDSRWNVASRVLETSILENTSVPVAITLLDARRIPAREHEGRTEFSILRYFIPWLMDFQGRALYIEQDMLAIDDLAKLFAMPMDKAVACVQHEYASVAPRPNWASVMLMNCEQLTHMTPEYINQQTTNFLHQMRWIGDDKMENLPARWNILDHLPEDQDIGILHYTSGGPWDRDKVKGERARDPRASLLWWQYAGKALT